MADVLDQIYLGTTKVHPAGASLTHGTSYVTRLDWGTPDAEVFLSPYPLADGMAFGGRVTKDRKFTMTLVVTGVGSAANGQDVWGEILALCHSSEGPVGVRYIREDTTTDRTIEAILLGEPAWRWKDGAGEGLSVGGSIMMTLQWQAPFPWWVDTAYNETTLTPSGTTPDSEAIVRGGDKPCGLEVKVSTAATLGGIALSDGVHSTALTATFNATPKGFDRFYTKLDEVTVDTGVVPTIPWSLNMHSATTTITATPADGSSGAHAVRIRWKRIWKVP